MRVNLLIIFLLCALLSSCGATKDEEIESAIVSANQFLSNKRCNEALQVLDSVGPQMSNPDWLSTYSSAQACTADWNVVRFFETDLDLLDTASETAIIGSLAVFSQANMSSPTDAAYTGLRNAITTLLSAANVSPISYQARALALGTSVASRLAIQTLYMQLAQLGKFARYFGNANASGTKGLGTGANECYLTYNDADAQAIANSAGLGTCDTIPGDTGHPDLTGNRTRLCEGIVLFNNFLDIVSNVTLDPTGNNGNIGDLDGLSTNLAAACATLSGPPTNYDFGGTCTVKTQSICESNAGGNYTMAHLERYYAAFWEGLHQ